MEQMRNRRDVSLRVNTMIALNTPFVQMVAESSAAKATDGGRELECIENPLVFLKS